MRLYLNEFKEHLSPSSKSKTKTVAVLVASLLIFSTIWYNFLLQYYYIIRLKMQRPSDTTSDIYFTTVYYTTVVFNELNFCLLIGVAAVVIYFTKVRLRRTYTRNYTATKTRSNSDTKVYTTPDGSQKFESRGYKPKASESFTRKRKELSRS